MASSGGLKRNPGSPENSLTSKLESSIVHGVSASVESSLVSLLVSPLSLSLSSSRLASKPVKSMSESFSSNSSSEFPKISMNWSSLILVGDKREAMLIRNRWLIFLNFLNG